MIATSQTFSAARGDARSDLAERRSSLDTDRHDGPKLAISVLVVLAAVIGISLFARSPRERFTINDAAYTLLYGQADATWTQRTSQLIVAEPHVADRLAGVIEDGSVDGVRRGLALDALASAGGQPAQAAMIAALSSRVVKADPVYPLLLSRLGQLASPTSRTMAFLERTNTEARRDGSDQLAYAAEQTLAEANGHRSHAGRSSD